MVLTLKPAASWLDPKGLRVEKPGREGRLHGSAYGVSRLTPTRGALLALQGALREDVVALEPQPTQMQQGTVQLEDLVLAGPLDAKLMEHVQVESLCSLEY